MSLARRRRATETILAEIRALRAEVRRGNDLLERVVEHVTPWEPGPPPPCGKMHPWASLSCVLDRGHSGMCDMRHGGRR